MKVHWNIQQGTAEWFGIRAGIPTASEFHNIITPAKGELSKSRGKYACRLIAERLLNWQAQSLDALEHIKRGKDREPAAIQRLEFVHDLNTREVGFVTTDDATIGASPDRFVMPSMLPTEVKCPSDPIQFEYLLLGHGDDYRPQVQGQLYVCEADEALFYAYNPRTPEYMVRTHRDEAYIAKLAAALRQFNDELGQLLEKAQSLGLYQAYASIKTPLDVERGDGIRRDPLTSAEEMAALIEHETQPGDLYRMGA